MSVKGNQPTLLHAAQTASQIGRRAHTRERSRGRQERRSVEVRVAPDAIKQQWSGLLGFVVVARSGWRDGRRYGGQAVYATSLAGVSARQMGRLIRGHWGIENRLHWVKDVQMQEDKCALKGIEAAHVRGVLGNAAVSLSRLWGLGRTWLEATVRASAQLRRLLQLLKSRT